MDRHLFSEVKRNRSCESVIGCKWTAVLVRFGGNFSLSHCVHFRVVRTCLNLSSPCGYVLSFKVQHSASNGKEWNCVPNSDHAWFYTIRCDATFEPLSPHGQLKAFRNLKGIISEKAEEGKQTRRSSPWVGSSLQMHQKRQISAHKERSRFDS